MALYNEHVLRDMASKMRAEIGGLTLPDGLLRKLEELIPLIEDAADGAVSQEDLRAAVDQVNLDLESDACAAEMAWAAGLIEMQVAAGVLQ